METKEQRSERYARMRQARRDKLIAAGLDLAQRDNYQFLKRADVAREARVSVGVLNHEFGTMLDFKRAVIAAAIATRTLRVIGQAIAQGSPSVQDIDPALKSEALASLAG
jgi:AcrR family transcriptional regulator